MGCLAMSVDVPKKSAVASLSLMFPNQPLIPLHFPSATSFRFKPIKMTARITPQTMLAARS